MSIVAAPTYSPTNSVRGDPFLHTLSSICYLETFNDAHSDRYEVGPHCSFNFRVSNNLWCWVYFHVLTGHLGVFFGERSIKAFSSFFTWVVLFSGCWVVWAVSAFWRLSPCSWHHLQIISPIPQVVFSFFYIYFEVQKLMSLIRSHLFIFIFISINWRDWPKRMFHLCFLLGVLRSL